MGSVESIFSDSPESSKKSTKPITPRCILLKNAPERIDKGFSFIHLDLTPSRSKEKIPTNRCIYAKIDSKVICFDAIELYSWLKTNPNALLTGPFGSVILSVEQKRYIISKAETYLPCEDRIDQDSQYHWNQGKMLGSILKHIGDQSNTTEDKNLCHSLYDALLNRDMDKDSLCDAATTKAVEKIIVSDDSSAALQMVDVFSALDIELNVSEKYFILERCVQDRASGVLGALFTCKDWLKGLDAIRLRI